MLKSLYEVIILEIKPIAFIKNDFCNKFGIPRQSGTTNIVSRIIFCDEYKDPSALIGIEKFSHLWLIWNFSEAEYNGFSPTVRPPRLGGNKRVGVFASRSPFRPNSLGLSCVKLIRIENGTELIVSGADLKNGTPIFDIKPYLPAFDQPKDAKGSYSDRHSNHRLEVIFPDEVKKTLNKETYEIISELISEDPRPSYQNDSERIYGFCFSDLEIKFTIKSNTAYVISMEKIVKK